MRLLKAAVIDRLFSLNFRGPLSAFEQTAIGGHKRRAKLQHQWKAAKTMATATGWAQRLK